MTLAVVALIVVATAIVAGVRATVVIVVATAVMLVPLAAAVVFAPLATAVAVFVITSAVNLARLIVVVVAVHLFILRFWAITLIAIV